MNAPSDYQLQKVTMNFYRDDVKELEKIFGNGWTTAIRSIIHEWIKERKNHNTIGGSLDGF